MYVCVCVNVCMRAWGAKCKNNLKTKFGYGDVPIKNFDLVNEKAG